jgi:hypothetical protein
MAGESLCAPSGATGGNLMTRKLSLILAVVALLCLSGAVQAGATPRANCRTDLR